MWAWIAGIVAFLICWAFVGAWCVGNNVKNET